MARVPPDGWRAPGVICLWKDSLLVYRVEDVSEVDSLPQWNMACLAGAEVGDLGALAEPAEVYPYGEDQQQPWK